MMPTVNVADDQLHGLSNILDRLRTEDYLAKTAKNLARNHGSLLSIP